jgi:hypothetical protein
MDIVTEGGKWLLTQGVLGVIAAALGWVAWTYKTELAKCYAISLEREKAMGEIVTANAVALSSHNAETAQRTRAIEAQAMQSQAQAMTIAEMNRYIGDLVQKIEKLQGEVIDLRRMLAEGKRS